MQLTILYLPYSKKIWQRIKFDEFMADDVCVRLNSVNINTFYENNTKAIMKMTNPLNYNLSIVVIRILKVNHQSFDHPAILY